MSEGQKRRQPIAKNGPRVRLVSGVGLAVLFFSLASSSRSADAPLYLEPGNLRLSHTLSLEGVFHAPQDGTRVVNDGRNKEFVKDPNANNAWTSDWGTNLLTEVAARFNKEISGRVLFDAQGSYADRFWRPLNANHDLDQTNNILLLRQAEAKIDEEKWFLHGFSGVSHDGWGNKGDIFAFYPGIYPERDYLGSSGYFGVYPKNWNQDQYLNISGNRVPTGGELGGTMGATEASVAYGKELTWGFNNSAYGRVRQDLGTSQLNFFFKNEDVPYSFNPADNERKEAYSLTWTKPSEDALTIETGVIYQPFRLGQTYDVAREAEGGAGVQGSSWNLGTKTVDHEDAWGGKIKLDG